LRQSARHPATERFRDFASIGHGGGQVILRSGGDGE
jgi:hypothetical protein